jgi:hypothetical protein
LQVLHTPNIIKLTSSAAKMLTKSKNPTTPIKLVEEENEITIIGPAVATTTAVACNLNNTEVDVNADKNLNVNSDNGSVIKIPASEFPSNKERKDVKLTQSKATKGEKMKMKKKRLSKAKRKKLEEIKEDAMRKKKLKQIYDKKNNTNI